MTLTPVEGSAAYFETRDKIAAARERQLAAALADNARLRAERDDAREQRRKWQEASVADRTDAHRLRALLNDKTYIRCKADYNRGHLSHANYLDGMESGLSLTHEQAVDRKP